MFSIIKATEKDHQTIVSLGNISVEEAHRDSCSAEDLKEYLGANYNDDAIKAELRNADNIYHIIYYNGKPAGFSKIILNADHANIAEENVTMLDRIYLLSEFFNMKLGAELLKFNTELAKQHDQSGMWLFTWVGNVRALRFYKKAGFEIIGSHNFQVSASHYNLNHQMFLKLI